jgi:hypothetical protein
MVESISSTELFLPQKIYVSPPCGGVLTLEIVLDGIG